MNYNQQPNYYPPNPYSPYPNQPHAPQAGQLNQGPVYSTPPYASPSYGNAPYTPNYAPIPNAYPPQVTAHGTSHLFPTSSTPPQPQLQPQANNLGSSYPPATYTSNIGSQHPHSWFSPYYKALSPEEKRHLELWFNSVDVDKSGQIDSKELSNMIMPGTGPFAGRILGFEAASQLIKLFDRDQSGTIDFYEYAALHSFMDKMNCSFHKADTNRNGLLDLAETEQALQAASFNASKGVVAIYFNKYNNKGPGLDFIQYMRMTTDIALIRTKFENLDKDVDGKLSLDEVLLLVGEMFPTNATSAPNRVTTSYTSTGQSGQCSIC